MEQKKLTSLRNYIRFCILEGSDDLKDIQSIGLLLVSRLKDNKDQDQDSTSIDDDLIEAIKDLSLAYRSTYYYGKNGIFIINISKEQLIEIAGKYSQGIAMFGERFVGRRDGALLKWQLIKDGKVRVEKHSNHPLVCPNFN